MSGDGISDALFAMQLLCLAQLLRRSSSHPRKIKQINPNGSNLKVTISRIVIQDRGADNAGNADDLFVR
jgi:hypothetical protein